MKFRLILACAVLATATQAAHATAGADSALLDMAAAAKRNDQRALTQLLPATRGHMLESWAAYWELRARLGDASPAEVRTFLERYRGTYAEDRMRNDWLLLLGQRRDWAAFEAELPQFRMRDDREVACYAAVVAHLKTGADTSADVLRNWHAIRDADDGCTYAADRLFTAKKISRDDIWLEARLSVENNRLRAATRAVEIASPDASARVAEAFNAPKNYLKRDPSSSRTGKELALLALVRLASTDAPAAVAALDRLDDQLSAEQRSYAFGIVGKYMNLRLDTDAYKLFATAQNEHLTDDLLGWKVRAALRAGQWSTVQRSIDAMSESAKREPIWVYWRAESVLAQAPRGESAERSAALQSLEGIAGVRGFYEMLALDRLGRMVSVPPKPEPITAAELTTARQHPGLQRALELIRLGLRPEGVREWNYTTNLEKPGGMSDRELLAAAAVACSAQVWDRCINTSERTKAVFDADQRFPMPFKDAVIGRSQNIGLDPAYVYGLIRQESRFILDARSHVGASGLMQVMPATARWTAKKIGLKEFKPSDINDRDTNIAIGTAYLKLVLDDMGGLEPLAAAAYNAGPGRPRNWRQGPVLDAAIWAENVPFNETRDYVKKVAANATLYAALITGQPQSIRTRLPKIGPRDAKAPADNKDLP